MTWGLVEAAGGVLGVRGEAWGHAENLCRKDFTPSESIAIGAVLEPMERAAAAERQRAQDYGRAVTSEKFSEVDKGRALAKVAASVGMSRPTYEKAKAVVEAAERKASSPRARGHCPT